MARSRRNVITYSSLITAIMANGTTTANRISGVMVAMTSREDGMTMASNVIIHNAVIMEAAGRNIQHGRIRRRCGEHVAVFGNAKVITHNAVIRLGTVRRAKLGGGLVAPGSDLSQGARCVTNFVTQAHAREEPNVSFSTLGRTPFEAKAMGHSSVIFVLRTWNMDAERAARHAEARTRNIATSVESSSIPKEAMTAVQASTVCPLR